MQIDETNDRRVVIEKEKRPNRDQIFGMKIWKLSFFWWIKMFAWREQKSSSIAFSIRSKWFIFVNVFRSNSFLQSFFSCLRTEQI